VLLVDRDREALTRASQAELARHGRRSPCAHGGPDRCRGARAAALEEPRCASAGSIIVCRMRQCARRRAPRRRGRRAAAQSLESICSAISMSRRPQRTSSCASASAAACASTPPKSAFNPGRCLAPTPSPRARSWR
jgi:hypothetical protein